RPERGLAVLPEVGFDILKADPWRHPRGRIDVERGRGYHEGFPVVGAVLERDILSARKTRIFSTALRPGQLLTVRAEEPESVSPAVSSLPGQAIPQGLLVGHQHCQLILTGFQIQVFL